MDLSHGRAEQVDAQRRQRDPRGGALYCERVPYVVVCGAPGRSVHSGLGPCQALNCSGGGWPYMI